MGRNDTKETLYRRKQDRGGDHCSNHLKKLNPNSTKWDHMTIKSSGIRLYRILQHLFVHHISFWNMVQKVYQLFVIFV